MDQAVTAPRISAKGPLWLRRYPPLLALILSLLIAVLILPSSLNLPQANPTQVAEFAPVPPEDEEPPSNEGSLSQLGLGISNSLTTAGEPSPPTPREGGGDRPITKDCVGNPPRQTEDPNSPPCVPHFEGDNGGETWQGVSADEITVLVYANRFCTTGSSTGGECSPAVGYCDVDSAPNSSEACGATDYGQQGTWKGYDHHIVQSVRALGKFFDDRFQTYDRRVHFWIYWTSANSPSSRRADAQANWERLKPFAIIDYAIFGGYSDIYSESMAKRRTMTFGSLLPRPAEYFRRYAPYLWNFWPDVEHAADMFVSYICQKVAPFPTVRNAGDDKNSRKMNGTPRRVGLLRTSDPLYPGLVYFGKLATVGIRNCPNGAQLDIVEEASHSRHQFAIDTHPDAVTEARNNIAKFIAAGVTTIVWAGGYETEHTKAAHNNQFYPEWFVAGDQYHDWIPSGRFQQQDVWRHAVLVSNFLLENDNAAAPCRQAYYEAEPGGSNDDAACEVYRSFFQLYKAIQVAGPYLSPEAIDQGHHTIPKQKSTSPYVAACFYDPGDFTCVKDATERWWDPDAPDPDGDVDEKGCWRVSYAGKRFIAYGWEGDDSTAFADRNDPCDNQGNVIYINPYGPRG